MKKVKFITKNTLTGEEGTRMTITNDGKIGIGTETPGKVLDVSGDINFTGTLFQNGEAFTSGADLATSSISELADVNLTGIATNQGLNGMAQNWYQLRYLLVVREVVVLRT